MTKIIHLISGPRNISTALMYSFGNRKDFAVVDEPMYARYLEITEKDHPGSKETMAYQSTRLREIFENDFHREVKEPYLFIKNMAHHLLEVPPALLKDYQHIFLIRNPIQIINSFTKVIKDISILDIGLKEEVYWYERLTSLGCNAVVLDSNEVLKDPKGVLTQLCEALNIPFDEAMLNWNKGAREEDGPWAKYWYHSVHQSTHFQKWTPPLKEVAPQYQALLEDAMPYYTQLYQHAIKSH